MAGAEAMVMRSPGHSADSNIKTQITRTSKINNRSINAVVDELELWAVGRWCSGVLLAGE